ncbi:hypothetical protein BZG78_00135 [Salinivibrio sp. MA351]|uniref:VTT domain-containing protein n=1 Tax=Salinivibrio costicola subsp. alcaliphilus TaxID=272773 RepID=A0ABX3KN09_SALCS|nr:MULTISPECIES: YqaA family protein [Salinivibrio]NUY56848.1 DedA family protein [Salinivibrio sp. EAGSL]OOE94178.1 hypothetical protein BZG76_00465 [Salinivibrio sp. AR647]OOE94632.1 hypothetical protein BZG75_05905 [Salinivibrio sp. AR640]OOF01285.1 hypothetical protein BZG78_00135 [Salinivibrio sp. MA351]OOF05403.1 hypothetical protein BZG81_06155 [Salinivibrio sp. MA607]
MDDWSALATLFVTSFLSATLLPGGSEANLVYLLTQQQFADGVIVAIATVGNTLGGMTNYAIGRWIPDYQPHQRWHRRAHLGLQRYGYAALLLSWVPIIGDPLCVVAGWLRLRQSWCWAVIFIAKASRYMVIVWSFNWVTG